jgi:predicted PurR-regulated permease PerM
MSQLPSIKLPHQITSIPLSTLLLSFVLAPAVRILQSWYFPRIVAVLVVGLFAFTTIFGLGALMVSQVTQLLPVICPATGQCFGKKFKACGARLRERETLERASEFLQDHSKDKGVGSERTAPRGMSVRDIC